MGFDVDKPRTGTKNKIPKKKMEQIEQYIDDMYDNTKQFALVLNELYHYQQQVKTIKIILCLKISSLKMK